VLLINTAKSVWQEIKDGFTSLPKGCFIRVERKAKEYILDNIRSSYGYRAGLISPLIASFTEDTGMGFNLANFLEYSI